MFDPVVQDDHVFHTGEDNLTVCIRQVVESAAWKRYTKVRSSGDWSEYLKWGTDEGLVGKDSNYDGNTLEGLVQYLRRAHGVIHVPINPTISDTKECGDWLRGRFTQDLLDEVLLALAVKGSQIQPVSTSDHIEGHKRSNSSIGRDNSSVSDNSTHSAVPFRPGHSTVINNPTIHNNWTIPINSTLLDLLRNLTLLNSTYHGVPFIRPAHLNVPGNSDIHERWTVAINSTFPVFPGNLAVTGNLSLPGNLTTGPYNSTSPFLLGKRNHPGDPFFPILPLGSTSLEELYVTQETIRIYLRGMNETKILDLLVEITKGQSLKNTDVMDIFGNNTDTVDRFYESPSVHDRVTISPCRKSMVARTS